MHLVEMSRFNISERMDFLLKHKIYYSFLFFCLPWFFSCGNSNVYLPEESVADSVLSVAEADSVNEIDAINRQAVGEWEHGNYQKAMDFALLAYDKALSQDDEKKLAVVLNTMGLIHWRLENYEDAMMSFENAGKIAQKYKMNRLLGLTHTNRGLIYKKENNAELAFFHNNHAIEIFEANNLFRDLAIALNNQGQIFKNQNNNDSAKACYLRALESYKKVDYIDGVAATYYNLSEVLMRQNKPDSSVKAARKSLELALQADTRVRIIEAYKRLSETFEYFQQPDSALKYLKLYNTHNNSLLVANQSHTLAKYQAEMGAEVKNLQIQNLEKEKALVKHRLWFAGIWVFIFILLAAFFIYRYFSKMRFRKKALERELENSRKILTVKEQELKAYILDLSKKNNLIGKLQEEVSRNVNLRDVDNHEVAELLEQKILTEEDWDTFKNKFDNIYPDFFGKMKQIATPLTEAEIRYMVLLRLELTGKEMANILGISPQSVRVCKMRLKKKLEKQGFDSVEGFLGYLL